MLKELYSIIYCNDTIKHMVAALLSNEGSAANMQITDRI